ncbi:MAG: hypothetical protein HQ511_00380 [Rhodospirillales bacterium]|nr:hypothetical protein [Rhodospirillales bacterium]
MKELDRDRIVSLLGQLGEPDDGQVLEAGRELHKLVTDENLEWDDLLVADEGLSGAPPAPVSNLEDSAVLSLIDDLLAREGLSDATRDELSSYKEDIAQGEFTEDDRRYLQALEARL